RAGVGMDNIDVEYARSKGIDVINTPAASSRSVAELAMAHMLTLTRSLQITNRSLQNPESFNALKKQLSSSTEVKGKNLVLIGFGRIGSELAKMALALEMKVLVVDPFINSAEVRLTLGDQQVDYELSIIDKNEALGLADYISLHAPFLGEAILGEQEFKLMKKSCIIINTSRGENIDEDALLHALDKGMIASAGLDVFQNEPNINNRLINHPKISLSPHIAASTQEAQLRIAAELVDKIIALRNLLVN
ncbi:MAG: NAD(P)-dependent oxidoreductase, partial [Saprospiraceae bacterium]